MIKEDKFGQGGVVCSLWRSFVAFGDLVSRLVLWLYCMASVFGKVPEFWPQN